MSRRLVLQMQTSADGYVEADLPGLEWQRWNWQGPSTWDRELQKAFNETMAASDTILLSRPMIDGGYLGHWEATARSHPDDPGLAFARRVGQIEKVVVSRSPLQRSWPRTRRVQQPLAVAVAQLKSEPGGDIIAFGGVRFATALAEAGLVDEFQFYVNPTAVGRGRPVPVPAAQLTLKTATAYPCGVMVLRCADERATRSDGRQGSGVEDGQRDGPR